MAADHAQLTRQLADAFDGTRTGNPHPWLWAPLLRLLAHGQPVSIERICGATGQTAATSAALSTLARAH